MRSSSPVRCLGSLVILIPVLLLACGATADGPEGVSESAPPSALIPETPAPETPAPEPSSGLSPSSPDASSSSVTSSFSMAMLAAHNACRAPFPVPKLEWSEDLAIFSQEWADDLAQAGAKLEHRKNNPYGENLYWISGGAATAAEVVESWCSEEDLYDPEKNDWWPNAAHFTQVVWHSTKRVGCAVARQGREEWWVCNYDPPGNYRRQRPY